MRELVIVALEMVGRSPQGAVPSAFRILLVDDDVDVRSVVARVLKRLGHTVVPCATAEEAEACEETFDVAVIDLNLGSQAGNGLNLLQRLEAKHPRVCYVLTSGSRPSLPAREAGGPLFLPKPFSRGDLVELFDAIRDELTDLGGDL